MADSGLRAAQKEIMAYTGGKLAVMAVPGSGKTFTLSRLAATLVERLTDQGVAEEQEVLIVTFSNSAVNMFRKRIADLLQQERGLLPYVGYRVRTLHALAHDIVRMRPGLVGLSEGFEILDESVTAGIIRDLAAHWLRSEGRQLGQYLDPSRNLDPDAASGVIYRHGDDLIETIAREAIRLAKDNRWDVADMKATLAKSPLDLPLARIGVGLYEQYQNSLKYRGAVDFDDLMMLAMQALHSDSEFLARLQRQWPFILEDEAQDSSQLQNEMLRMLSADRNWVRVGDPNQSIYTTFTTANANLLRQFAQEPEVIHQPLPESGRSALPIIALANQLVAWSRTDRTIEHLHDALSDQQIEPTRPGDEQQNPAEFSVYFDWDPQKNITPEAEIERVVKSLKRWIPDHPDWTVAVLVPENNRGFKLAEALREEDIEYEELLKSTSATRSAANKLQISFDFLSDPLDSKRLSHLFSEVWWPRFADQLDNAESEQARDALALALRDLKTTEDFLWPGIEHDWLASLSITGMPERTLLDRFQAQMQVWLQASSLPVDQLTLTLSQDLFENPTDLALGHKIAVVLKGIAASSPEYRLPELSQELRQIASNQRRFLGFDDASVGYEPTPGRVTIATMHAAKGLEWDRVYLMSVNNYSFPAGLPGDSYLSEKWFLRDELNMQAETHAQIISLMNDRAAAYVEGEASKRDRLEYAAERLRLLYVGITRARRDLIFMWNMGRFWDQGRKNSAAAALIALSHWWKEHYG
jgi:DNA helicase-2/ATP-dependent DNA helicase PcrA